MRSSTCAGWPRCSAIARSNHRRSIRFSSCANWRMEASFLDTTESSPHTLDGARDPPSPLLHTLLTLDYSIYWLHNWKDSGDIRGSRCRKSRMYYQIASKSPLPCEHKDLL